MTDAKWQKHMKALGKLVRLWDLAAAQVSALKYTASAFVDQIATAAADTDGTSWPVINAMSPYVGSLNSAFAAGPSAIQSVAAAMAQAYITNFVPADMTTQPSVAGSITSIITAMITEATSVSNTQTFTASGSTGFLHFIATVFAGYTGSFPTSGSPSLPDATYCVDAVV